MRFDLTIHAPGYTYPSWVDLDAKLFCGQVGSARPIPTVEIAEDGVRWSLPKQYEDGPGDLTFEGVIDGDRMEGNFIDANGVDHPFVGFLAPELPYRDVTWGEPVDLVKAGLSAWHARDDRQFLWIEKDGELVNTGVGSDLVTNEAYDDFRLVARYRYDKDANSGIYLRGRYEFQVLDDAGQAPHVGGSGGIYGLLVPTVNAAKPAGEINEAVIELVGRYVTVDFNGVRIHDRAEIAGPTGGALDSNEGEPQSLFVQGDHGPVVYCEFSISRPA